nr:hypothetical protein CFP56_04500 [Quercus suber]
MSFGNTFTDRGSGNPVLPRGRNESHSLVVICLIMTAANCYWSHQPESYALCLHLRCPKGRGCPMNNVAAVLSNELALWPAFTGSGQP